jgi:hypothetical protein
MVNFGPFVLTNRYPPGELGPSILGLETVVWTWLLRIGEVRLRQKVGTTLPQWVEGAAALIVV